MKFTSISKKLMTLLTVTVLISLGIVGTIRAHQITNKMNRVVYERLVGYSNAVVGLFDAVHQQIQGTLEIIAQMPNIHNAMWLEPPYSQLQISNTLHTFYNSFNRDRDYSIFETIFIIDNDLNLVAMVGETMYPLDLSLFTDNLVHAQNGLPFASSITRNPVTGQFQFLFSHPILSSDQNMGMVGIFVNAHSLDHFLLNLDNPAESFVSLIGSNGKIFFSNRAEYIGHHLYDLGIIENFGYLPHGRIFDHTSPITGEQQVAYAQSFPHVDWLAIGFFETSSLDNVPLAVVQSLAPTTGLMIIASLIIIALMVKTLKPLKSLAEKANQVAQGHLDIDFHPVLLPGKPPRSENEISQVFDAFEMVVQSTKLLIEKEQVASRAKSDFLAHMSHEIRTPLNAILGMAEITLQNDDLPQPILENTYTIKNSGEHLLHLINDILDFSKIESGKTEIIHRPYHFHSAINDVVTVINARISNPNLIFSAYMEKNVPNQMIGDSLRIKQILLNLLTNAVKYTRSGRVVLNVSWKAENHEIGTLLVSVKDTGIGIKPEDLHQLFVNFSRFDIDNNRQIEGTGLGLPITKSLIELMHGTIDIKSTYGEGSTFTITIPQTYQTDPHISKPDLFEHVGNKKSLILGKNYPSAFNRSKAFTFTAPTARVLVVDDSETNLLVAKGLIAPYGIHVDTALSGEGALAFIDSHDYDIVFMDQMMPELDGLETVSRIRNKSGKYADLAIVALTANAIVGVQEMFLASGFNDFLPKPIKTKSLDIILSRYIPTTKKEALATVTYTLSISQQVRRIFVRDALSKIDRMHEAIEDGDIARYRIYIHGLKSFTANIGAVTLSQQAAALENQFLGKQLPTLDRPQFVKQHQAFIHDLTQLVDHLSVTDTNTSEASFDSEQLTTLKKALQSFDIATIDDLSKDLQNQAIADAILIGDYADAIVQIDALLSK